jgi:hypothetical protein
VHDNVHVQGYIKYTLRRPGAACQGAVGYEAVSLEPLLGTSAASGFTVASRYLSAPPFTMAPKLRTARPPADTPNDLEETSHHNTRDIFSPPPDGIALVQEQMALINARLNARAIEIVAHRQRDA